MPENQVTGLILAGGRARRMEGRAKGLLPLSGRPLIAHVLERFAPQVERILINANDNRTAYAAYGHPVVADVVAGFVGPLAGLHAGLQACTTPLLACVPCDAPLLPGDLVARLHAALAANIVAVASTDGRIQPTFMLCRREVCPALERYLAAGGRSIQAWLAELDALAVPFADPRAFTNINTPAELAQLDDTLDALPTQAYARR